MKQYFTFKNLFWGFVVGLIYAALAMWALGAFMWGALIFIPICCVGVPLIKYRDVELAKVYEDRM